MYRVVYQYLVCPAHRVLELVRMPGLSRGALAPPWDPLQDHHRHTPSSHFSVCVIWLLMLPRERWFIASYASQVRGTAKPVCAHRCVLTTPRLAPARQRTLDPSPTSPSPPPLRGCPPICGPYLGLFCFSAVLFTACATMSEIICCLSSPCDLFHSV